MNLRRHQRFPIRLSGVVTGPMSDESVGMTVNLSRQGCLIETICHVNTGDVVNLRIDVPGDASPILITQATVRWNLVGMIGVGFIKVDPSEQARLDQLLERMNHDQQT
jgi:PilZ domain